MIRLILLCVAIVLFLIVAFIDFGWLGVSGGHTLGLTSLGLGFLAASFLPIPDRRA